MSDLDGDLSPDLRHLPVEVHAVWQGVVIRGVLEARGMVGFAVFASPEDAEVIRQYVLSEADRLYDETAAN